LVEGPVLPRAVFTGKMPRKWLIRPTVPLGIASVAWMSEATSVIL
jgi:hypothetical protein